MAKRFPIYPKYIGTPLTPLSPHNSEISESEAKSDQDALGLNSEVATTKRRGVTKRYLSKRASRPDSDWEIELWNFLHSDRRREKWLKVINQENGWRIYQNSKMMLVVVCDPESSARTLKWSGKSGYGPSDYREITVPKAVVKGGHLAVLGGLIAEFSRKP